MLQHIKEIPDTGNSFVVGGRAEQVTIEVYPERLAGYGLSLAHHRTMALFAPALLAYVWILEKGALWRDGRRLLRLGALVLAPLLLYLYLPWGEARGLPGYRGSGS